MVPPRLPRTGDDHAGRILDPRPRTVACRPPSLGDMWRRHGCAPGVGLTMTPTADGAVIHPTSGPVPTVIPLRCTPATRGRTLHIAAGVDLHEVGTFVDTLPLSLRPANYTVASGVTLGEPR
jgi:hypothetical protein